MSRFLALPLLALTLSACGESITEPVPVECDPFLLSFQAAVGDTSTTALGVRTIDVVEGGGDIVTRRSTVDLNYTLYDPDGAEYQTTCSPNQAAFQFALGVGAVITGFEDGVVGAREGTVRRILIPDGLGYTSGDLAGSITFDVQIIKVYE